MLSHTHTHTHTHTYIHTQQALHVTLSTLVNSINRIVREMVHICKAFLRYILGYCLAVGHIYALS